MKASDSTIGLPKSLIAASALICQLAVAQPLVSIETVKVGDVGNAADTRPGFGSLGYGSVGYEFNIGKYEVTIGQYLTFLTSAASITSESYLIDLWNPSMASRPSAAGISRSGSGTSADPYLYSVIGPLGITPTGASSPSNRPIGFVSWFGAARFANWISNGATNGASTEDGTYSLNGATSGIFLKNPAAAWWIPTEDEWYKAAYYKGGGINAGYWLYPTQSDTAPGNQLGSAANQANYNNGVYSVTQSNFADPNQNYLNEVGAFSASEGAYGTFDQAGNLKEWNDGVIAGTYRSIRGGNAGTGDESLWSTMYEAVAPDDIAQVDYLVPGFRLATVPEPSSFVLLLAAGAGAILWARRLR